MDHPILRATMDLKPEHRALGPDAQHTNCCGTYSSGLVGGGERDVIFVLYNHRTRTRRRKTPSALAPTTRSDAGRCTSPRPIRKPARSSTRTCLMTRAITSGCATLCAVSRAC
jgi:hypothetical protein